MPSTKAGIAIVGAGVFGHAHDYLAACAGQSVAEFEMHSHATGASTLDFGMFRPMNHSSGVPYITASIADYLPLPCEIEVHVEYGECL